jgi:HD-like signal output (HDOD) protein/ActR/RegA family two-component response regulator
MKNILFVDDEPMVLQGLQRMLRPHRGLWDMSFAAGGAEALAMLETKPFDAVVTDMRMPGMDGARLLELVRERYPATIRMVLSGYFESETAMRAVPVAHQFLAKPCDPEKLREAIERCCGFANLLPDVALRRVVGALGKLPALPRNSVRLVAALQNPDVPLDEIGGIVERDVGITAKILQLVNSAFFCLPNRVTSVRMAVSYLGLDTLKQLVLSVEIFRSLQPSQPIAGFSLEDLQKHSHRAARIASLLPASQTVLTTGVVAAVLHDAGKLVLAARLPHEFQLALQSSQAQQRPLHVVEEEQLGTTHAEIGAYLLGLWGLPDSIVDAVCRHHRPLAPEGARGLDALAITHIADGLACEVARDPAEDAPAGGVLDLAYLAHLGLDAALPAWRIMAQQVYEEVWEE